MIRLSDIPTTPPADYDKDIYKKKLKDITKKIGKLAEKLYADRTHSILVVLQGLDSSGKDGSTEKVFRYCSPLNVRAYGYGKPTEEEFAHDFLWRIHKRVPPKGNMHIFLRSHYEDILIQRVHKWIGMDRVKMRMDAINAFEQLLQEDNNTTVLKFYLHISKERQREKLQERIDNPDKHWKHNANDWEERKKWDDYIEAYEYAINNSAIPWIITPVDSRTYRNYFIAKKVLETLESFDLKWPVNTNE